jgi:flagellar protein FliS
MSDARSAISAYRQATYEGAPPLKIVRLMYEGALRFLAQARALDPARQPAEFAGKLDRAVAVVEELRLSLDPAHAPELTRNLSSLYFFVEERIQAARAQRNAEPLSAAERVLTTLLEAWAGLELPPAPPRAGAA